MAGRDVLVPVEAIASLIHVVRGRRVMFDADLARLYGVATKRLNEQVRRNQARFPDDFAFQLTPTEATALRSQIATSNKGRGGRRAALLAFTEHGAVMLASVLNSPVAVETSIQVVRAFVQLRVALGTHADLARGEALFVRSVEGPNSRHPGESRGPGRALSMAIWDKPGSMLIVRAGAPKSSTVWPPISATRFRI